MIVVYLAGPFRAPTEYQRRQHVAAAEAVALAVWRAGHVALCPHLNTAHFDGEADDAIWLAGDRELLRRSDGVLLLPTWNVSAGARAERAYAIRIGKPVWYALDEVQDFARSIGPLAADELGARRSR